MARKTKYTEDMPELAEMYARQGLGDKEIWHNLGLSRYTFYEYKKRYPEFAEAIKRGKAPVDYHVENAMLKRAMGYDYIETTVIKEIIETDGDKLEKIKEEKHITKHVPASVGAQIFWLCNRKPEFWKQLSRVDITTKGKELSSTQISLTQKEIEEINKQLEDEF